MHSQETSTPIYFIHLGDTALPSYYRHSLSQARENYKGRICLVCEQPGEIAIEVCQALDINIAKPSTFKKSAAHRDFLAYGNTDKSFRDGFWTFVIERFFTLEEVMIRDQARAAIHLEGDNLIFTKLEDLISDLVIARPALAVPFDHERRGIAGFMWVGSIDALSRFTNFIRQLSLSGSLDRMNDMDLLGHYREVAPRDIDSLPVLPNGYDGSFKNLRGEEAKDGSFFTKDQDLFGGIFDANALGQYVDGIDPRNTGGKDTRGFINETAMHNFSKFETDIKLSLSNDGTESAFLIDTYQRSTRIINIHVHSKRLLRYRYHASKLTDLQPIPHPTEIPDWDIITSERLQGLADLTITDYNTHTTHHHSMHNGVIDSAVIDFRDFNSYANRANIYRFQHAEILFVHTHLLEEFITYLLPLRIEPFVLITHASDHSVTNAHIKLLEDVRLVHWFAQNCEISDPKITPIPIGLANANWPHGDLEIFNAIRRSCHERRRELFSAHSLKTHASRIQTTISLIENGFEVFDRAFEYEEYLVRLKSSFFVASPRGNGLDCHRTWEALYCGAIPIVDEHQMYNHFSCLPILRVSDWTKLRPGALRASLDDWDLGNTDKLRLSFWAQSILLKLRSF